MLGGGGGGEVGGLEEVGDGLGQLEVGNGLCDGLVREHWHCGRREGLARGGVAPAGKRLRVMCWGGGEGACGEGGGAALYRRLRMLIFAA